MLGSSAGLISETGKVCEIKECRRLQGKLFCCFSSFVIPIGRYSGILRDAGRVEFMSRSKLLTPPIRFGRDSNVYAKVMCRRALPIQRRNAFLRAFAEAPKRDEFYSPQLLYCKLPYTPRDGFQYPESRII
jgi:hypothetical protein